MNSKYDFESRAKDAIAERALNMQNKFLDRFKEPRSVLPIDMNVSRGDLLKATYIRLLEGVVAVVNQEIEELKS